MGFDMAKNLDLIRDVLQTHYDEAADGLVEKSPSRLARGEGTRKNYYILKIDLVNSTVMLRGRRPETYLKYAHTFLSTVDRITQSFGADAEQVEYAGDSVLAYFPDSVNAFDVVKAACFAKVAVEQMRSMDRTLGSLPLACKIVLHYDALTMARIGPRASSFITAIGFPIHRVAKLEKEIMSGTGRATREFFRQLAPAEKRYLSAVYLPAPAEVAPAHTCNELSQPSASSLLRQLGMPARLPPQNPLADALYGRGMRQPSAQQAGVANLPIITTVPVYAEVIGYDLKWQTLLPLLELA